MDSVRALQCNGCFKLIGRRELLSCVKCKSNYHYQCLNIAVEFFRDNSNSLKQAWQCPMCTNETRRGRNENTPVGKGNDSTDKDRVVSGDTTLHKTKLTSPKHQDKKTPTVQLTQKSPSASGGGISGVPMSGAGISYEDFEKLLESKLSNIEASITQNIKTTIRTEINAAIEKLKTEFSETTDFLSAQQEDLQNEIKTANKAVKSLEVENEKLTKELNTMGGRLSLLEKSSRSCNLEIQSFPERKQENLTNTLKTICTEIGCPLQEKDINLVRRVAKFDSSTSRPRNILVTLTSEGLRNNVITHYKNYNKAHVSAPLNSSQFGMPDAKTKIYLVEHLPPETKKIHAEARKIAKTLNYKFVWVKYGRVYMRKNEEGDVIHIKNLDSLNKLI